MAAQFEQLGFVASHRHPRKNITRYTQGGKRTDEDDTVIQGIGGSYLYFVKDGRLGSPAPEPHPDILIDGSIERQEGILLQIFMENMFGPIFFEIIQRKAMRALATAIFRPCSKASNWTR
jgi:4-hydroxyphenylpyruvate dioxygenase-like putative hemolysin